MEAVLDLTFIDESKIIVEDGEKDSDDEEEDNDI